MRIVLNQRHDRVTHDVPTHCAVAPLAKRLDDLLHLRRMLPEENLKVRKVIIVTDVKF